MIETKFTLLNETGFHARPASIFVKEATGYSSDVFIVKDGEKYNAKSIMGLLSMGAGKGTEILLQVSGDDEEAASSALIEVLKEME
ncbi:HPr family phosphocarrier protein [Fusibacter sp. JL216-2]|uniref:HPr family phosphocarrier protein n=1 Tax=Fusibacter sp. JL216-2 TaxID=3071453 RepID=UPI003D34925D